MSSKSTTGPRVARLVPPSSTKKRWTFQIFNVTRADVWRMRDAFRDPKLDTANPFLQGDGHGSAEVQFNVLSKDIIDEAAQILFDLFNLEFVEGDFPKLDPQFSDA